MIFILIIVSFLLLGDYFILHVEKQREKNTLSAKISESISNQQKAENAEKKKYLTGKYYPLETKGFSEIPKEIRANEFAIYLKDETLSAFIEMHKAATVDKIDFKIISATRNFNDQKNIWENKWNGTILSNNENLFKKYPDEFERFNKILEYSAIPGTSRHHWGTDIDINSTDPNYFKTEKGIKEYAWLVKNAPLFGFCQPYTLKGQNRPTGYYEEKWHWSYKPISQTLTEEYAQLIKNEDLNGFLGDQYVIGQNIINNYVLGINPDCL